jgi:D-alanyl-D-alanine carboxypeptidase
MSLDFGPECGGVYEGHDGGLAGYLSMLLSTGDGTRRLEVSVTLGAINPTDPQAAERLWGAFGTLLITAACGSSQPAAPEVSSSESWSVRNPFTAAGTLLSAGSRPV